MTANVVGSGGVPDSTYGQARHRPGEPPAATAPAASTPEASAPPAPYDLLLMIEEAADAGGYVYITIDRRTGQVIRRLDRDQLLQLRGATSYAAGAVISTRA